MPSWLKTNDKGFAENFREFLALRQEEDSSLRERVSAIIKDTRARGDQALIDSAQKFDGVALNKDDLRLSSEDIQKTAAECPSETRKALDFAASRIEAWHKKQKPENFDFKDDENVELSWRWQALDSVGLYIPGGHACYPSTVLMNAIPAQLAGVKRIAAATPANATDNPLLMAALERCGISEVWRMGGATAIAALAYGTKSVAPVDKITGPGNAYVAEAKRQVFGDVGIDMIAGPSEILIIAEKQNNPEWIAADLLSQAEHDENAQSILITDDEAFAQKIAAAVDSQLAHLTRKAIASASWQKYGAIIIADTISDAAALANQIAAEHVEVLTQNPKAFAQKIRHAGSIFLGPHTPEVLGDYVIGANHILPTARAARYASGLGLTDFMKRSSILQCPPGGFAHLADAAITLAEAEGLQAHAFAAAIRLRKNTPP